MSDHDANEGLNPTVFLSEAGQSRCQKGASACMGFIGGNILTGSVDSPIFIPGTICELGGPMRWFHAGSISSCNVASFTDVSVDHSIVNDAMRKDFLLDV